ncbi:PucR family transcriptional regulator ligand-binding domain-containing protein [Nocardiopsis sp. EMB25]|uniref:PucR family transcriptional regulator n=1 Tax=Nocardiopsis sp. EMB25 TaxID=2835867 RepID=UPI0022847A5C|nr:PucR family transcriptional regulator ligand-binding domain-containing protein [Nocardiopsis sp. EMB25]MCY9783936.1 PucR family transcriptional regulator ligand-binding domain-containing protein [Nocardiopsis sp. EMB25]
MHTMLTLRSLATDPALRLRVLVEGDREWGLPVRWVHNTELPDPSPYLREHELVMTNGLWFSGPDSARAFVASVSRAGGAGIVFGLREETPNTPPELVRSCREAGMPLLELGMSIPFTEVSQAAAGHYAEQRQHDLVDLVRRNNSLVESASHGGGMSRALEILHRDHPRLRMYVVDRSGRCLASTGGRPDRADVEAVSSALSRRPPPLEVGLASGETATLFLIDTLGAFGGAGAALACLEPMRELSGPELESLEQVARFLSLEVAREELTRTVEMRFAGELLDMISSGAREEQEVVNRLRAFGVDGTGSLAVCALGVRRGERGTGLSERVRRFFVDEFVPVAVAEGVRDTVAVFPWVRSESELTGFAERLSHAVTERPNAEGAVVVGLGAVAEGTEALRAALWEARECCRILSGRTVGPLVGRFGDLGMYRLLLGHHSPEELHALAEKVLGPVRAYDQDRGGRLVATLRAFLDADGNWNATAAALHVHVNTLRNRLAKVAELTGLDVGRTPERVDLFLALEAQESANSR